MFITSLIVFPSSFWHWFDPIVKIHHVIDSYVVEIYCDPRHRNYLLYLLLLFLQQTHLTDKQRQVRVTHFCSILPVWKETKKNKDENEFTNSPDLDQNKNTKL